MKVGDKVRFAAKVFKMPYSPWYNNYKNHEFKIIGLHYGNTHVALECVTGNIEVKGYVHPSELVLTN